jgi:putative Ca2+/H+ antiporter (TMEM165/GDT1 family)
LIGSFLNHGIAVIFGKYIGGKIPAHLLQMIAGAAFILFAIWTLSEDDQEDLPNEDDKKNRGAVITVASAFFIGELGDKTQLTAITLSVDAAFPLLILLGTVSGMLVTSAIGILVGTKVGDKMPDFLIKIISGTVFLIFGVQKLYDATPEQFITPFTVGIFTLSILVTITLLIRSILTARKAGKVSAYRRAAGHLYEYSKLMARSVDRICLGETYCGVCKQGACAIGYIRDLANELIEGQIMQDEKSFREEIQYHRNKFDPIKLAYSLAVTVDYILTHEVDDLSNVNEIRKVLEMLLFDSVLPWQSNIEDYFKEASDRNMEITKLLKKKFKQLKHAQNRSKIKVH